MESETRTTAPTKQQLLQARRRRRVVKFEENPPARVYNANMSAADGAAQPAPPTPPAAGPGPGSTNHMISFELGGGWQVKLSNCTAPLTKNEARTFARTVLNVPSVASDRSEVRCQRPWAVRGEVPYEDPRVQCACVDVIQGGVRMKLPEKVFGRNFLELKFSPAREERSRAEEPEETPPAVAAVAPSVTISVDAADALRRWVTLSLDVLDDRRSEKKDVWSGWSLGEDRFALARSWIDRASPWAKASGFTHREEWEWTYRTDFAATCLPASSGTCERTLALWDRRAPACSKSSGVLLPLSLGPTVAATKAIKSACNGCTDGERVKESRADSLRWLDDPADDGSDACAKEFTAAWRTAAGAPLENSGPRRNGEFKLFEDFLDELGLAVYGTAALPPQRLGASYSLVGHC